MTTYIDSSVLVAVYVSERFSNAARQTVRAAPQVPFTQLHELEVPNAFELLVGRGSISREECRAIQAHLQEDLVVPECAADDPDDDAESGEPREPRR